MPIAFNPIKTIWCFLPISWDPQVIPLHSFPLSSLPNISFFPPIPFPVTLDPYISWSTITRSFVYYSGSVRFTYYNSFSIVFYPFKTPQLSRAILLHPSGVTHRRIPSFCSHLFFIWNIRNILLQPVANFAAVNH